MSTLPEVSTFDDVYQLETTDPVQGGASGVSNTPLKNLTNRTRWLRDRGLRANGSVAYSYSADITLPADNIGKHLKVSYTGIGGHTLTIPTAGVTDGQLQPIECVGVNLVTIAGIAGVTSVFPGMQFVARFNGTTWEVFATEETGSIIAFARNVPPVGFLKCNGAAVSRTTYARLFAIVGTTFGVGDGTTTFNLPDLRGQFVRGWSDGATLDSGRTFGSDQDATVIQGSVYESGGNLAVAVSEYDSISAGSGVQPAGAPTGGSSISDYSVRPTNVALLYCIRI